MRILNFSIIAHIDHGKSTLAKKLLELSNNPVNQKEDGIDNMQLEKERGITIKAKILRLFYSDTTEEFQFNMLDTPGHVDFNYEVDKVLQVSDLAILLVDAVKGVQAQTISNVYKALEKDVTVIPVINKIDMPNAQIDKTLEEIKAYFGFNKDQIHLISAKTGEGVTNIIEILKKHAKSYLIKENEAPLGLIFDSYYDDYLGVVAFVKVYKGTFKKGDEIALLHSQKSFKANILGYFSPQNTPLNTLNKGEVGYIATGLKDLKIIEVGETIYKKANQKPKPLANIKKAKPFIYLGVFPETDVKVEDLRKALEILNLTDPSFTFKPESAGGLGYGYNCGFLGILHADIILERLKREFGLNLIVTTPTVTYKVREKSGKEYTISGARELPDPSKIDYIEEPIADLMLVCPESYLGSLIKLINEKRGTVKDIKYSQSSYKNVKIEAQMPLGELIIDFSDKLKSISSGYASFDYELKGYQKAEIVKIDFLIGGDLFSPLSQLIHKKNAISRAREILKRLKEELPRQQFTVSLQAAIGGKIIARENLQAYRKDVTAKLYGGDRTRRMKLLEKQKKGKKKMKQLGKVNIGKDTFLKVIKSNG